VRNAYRTAVKGARARGRRSHPVRLARAVAPAVAVAGLASAAVVGLPAVAQATPVCTGLGGTVSCTYTTVGPDTFTVPANVTSLAVTATGGAGGNGASNGASAGGTGGTGAVVTRTLTVVAGSTLGIVVGGAGGNGSGTTGGAGGAGDGTGTGTGGHGGGTGFAGGGGGASSGVTIASVAKVVAPGGGGGGGAGDCAPAGGGAGGDGTAAGTTGNNCSGTGGAGGAAGGNGTADGANAAAGASTRGAGGGGGGGVLGGAAGGAASADVGQGGGGGGGTALGTLAGQGSPAANGSVTISYASTLMITTGSPLPGGTVGRMYSKKLAASGGTPPDSWSKVSGTLPKGLSLSSAGTISGKPAAKGTSTFTVQVQDDVGATVSKQFRLSIGAKADLAVALSRSGTFRHGKKGTYRILVTNTGSTATSATTQVSLLVPGGLTVIHGGRGTFWQCHKQKHSSFCSRSATIRGHATTTITVTVRVRAAAGTVVTSTVSVSPGDATPADNTASDSAVVRR
jgi:uncharacterized repeat protein (TIGR01451 family)